MTTEQIIILGFIAAAFVVGWVTRALTGDRDSDRTAARRRRSHEAREPGQTVAGSTLTQEVRNALESDAANTSMLDVVSPDRGELTDLELDLTDWGFT